MGTFLCCVMQCKSAATPTLSLGFRTAIEVFQMKYCMMFCLKGHVKLPQVIYLELQLYLIKTDLLGAFNFDLWQF